jgi:hypothetical protein
MLKMRKKLFAQYVCHTFLLQHGDVAFLERLAQCVNIVPPRFPLFFKVRFCPWPLDLSVA